MSYAKSKNLTVYDVLTIASMIDKEVQVPSERPLVAAVIYNRLHRGMPLGIDATTRFEFHNYTGEITESQLKSPSPYNTRINAGLPPTPIGNPGLCRDPGGGPARQGQLPLLRAEGERERPALLHRERGGVQPIGGRLQRGPGARELPQLTAGGGGPETKRLAVLGHPVSHSRSPAMQSAALEALGLAGRVELRGDRPGPRRSSTNACGPCRGRDTSAST